MRLYQCFLILISLWAAIYLPALGSRELQGEEARRTLPGRTMIQTGEWIVPRSGGEVYNRKPPLVNWASAAAIKVTGRMDEWTVRMPSVLMMLALGITMLLSLRGWLGNERALLAALIALTSIGFIEKGRLIEIEALYMSLYGMALALWLGLRWNGRELASWMAAGLMLGFGFLAKGPLHVWYFYALVIAVLAEESRLRDLLNWRHFAGLAVFFATFMPWAVLNSLRNPLHDSGKVWQDQITHRLGFAEFDFGNYLLQIPQSLINFLPWAVFLPLCWSRAVTTAWHNAGRHGQWMLGLRRGLPWAFLVIAILPSSRPRFMLPLNTGAAILVADALAMMGQAWLERRGRWWKTVMAAIASLGFGALLVLPVQLGTQKSQPWAWLCALAVAGALVLWLWRSRPALRPLTLGLQAGAALAVLACAFAVAIVPRVLPREKLRPFAAKITAQTGATDPIMLYQVNEHMWPFYLGQRCYEVAALEEMPKAVPFLWMIVPVKVWSVPSKKKALIRSLGPVVSESSLEDPLNHGPYALVHFKR